MIVGVPRETFPGERRVALVPAVIPTLAKAGLQVVVEAGAGIEAGYPDADYAAKGAKILADRAEVFRAAGTLTPARVLIIGCGVAGLQAIATARRLGAVVSAYDLRPAVKEQVQSLGGRFVELPIEAKDAQDARGYARAQDEEFYRKQRELLGKVVAESDVVITTAVVPGKKSPVLVTKEMVAGMAPGSVIVDLAAERGGNCDLTRAGEKLLAHGVTLIGSFNLASTVPHHASQMYARNLTAFLLHFVKDGKLQLDTKAQIIRETLLTQNGEIVSPPLREFFSLPPLATHLRA